MFTQDFHIPRSINIENSWGHETICGTRDSSPPTCRCCDKSDCPSERSMRASDSVCSTSSIVRIIETFRTISIVLALANSSTAQPAPFTANSYWSFDYEADHQGHLLQSDISCMGNPCIRQSGCTPSLGRRGCRKDDAV